MQWAAVVKAKRDGACGADGDVRKEKRDQGSTQSTSNQAALQRGHKAWLDSDEITRGLRGCGYGVEYEKEGDGLLSGPRNKAWQGHMLGVPDTSGRIQALDRGLAG